MDKTKSSKAKGNQVAPAPYPTQQPPQQQPVSNPQQQPVTNAKQPTTYPQQPATYPQQQPTTYPPQQQQPVGVQNANNEPPAQVKEAKPNVPPLRRTLSPQPMDNRKTFSSSKLLYNSEPSWRSEKAAREARGGVTPPPQKPRDQRQPIGKQLSRPKARESGKPQMSHKSAHHQRHLAPPPSGPGHPKQAWTTPRGQGQQHQQSARRHNEHKHEQAPAVAAQPAPQQTLKVPKGILKNKVNPEQNSLPRPVAARPATGKLDELSALPPLTGVLVDIPVRVYNEQAPEQQQPQQQSQQPKQHFTEYETIAGTFVVPNVRTATELLPDFQPTNTIHDFSQPQNASEFGAAVQSPTPSQQTLVVWAPTPLPPGTRLFSPPLEPSSVLGHPQQWQDTAPTTIISTTGDTHAQDLNEPIRMLGQPQQWEQAFPTSILPSTVGIFQNDDLVSTDEMGETNVTPSPLQPLSLPVPASVASTALSPYVGAVGEQETPESPYLNDTPSQGQYPHTDVDEVSYGQFSMLTTLVALNKRKPWHTVRASIVQTQAFIASVAGNAVI
jgi:hypothetical protein